MTLRPTIASASSGGDVFAVSNVATISPRRMTETRSVNDMISRNLWVMKMMVLFSRLSTRSISNNWSASAGVSTAVGSSSTRISAPRTSALRISTRCCRPTDNSPTMASGSTTRPYSRPSSAEPLADRARAFGEQRPALGAEHHVFEHGERRHQHEVLVHHADAVADRLARGADPDRLAVDADLASVGFIEAVQNRHQCRFAGAVLADDAVDDSALDDEVDVVVGVNRAEALIDADEFDGGSRGQVVISPSRRRGGDPTSFVSDRMATNEDKDRRRWPDESRPSQSRATAFLEGRSAQDGHLLSDM